MGDQQEYYAGGNIAAEYIDRLQANANKLDGINQTIKKYNEALGCCRNGSSDVAVIQLKKILTQNPKLIKAYHLLALNYIHEKEYEKARRILKKAAKLIRQTPRRCVFSGKLMNRPARIQIWNPDGTSGEISVKNGKKQMIVNDVILPPAFRRLRVLHGFEYRLRASRGACVVWFLFVPARVQSINREANQKVTEYSNTMASQAAELSKMEDKIRESEETANICTGSDLPGG